MCHISEDLQTWKYREENAFDKIILHDCRSDSIRAEGDRLVINFPDGFWLLPASGYIDNDVPLKTGPAQLQIQGLAGYCPLDSVDLFKTTYLFRKPVLCRRIRMDAPDFLKRINDGNHELEFLWEYHRPGNALYQCWLWQKDNRVEAECQMELTVQSIQYCWNEVLPDRKW